MPNDKAPSPRVLVVEDEPLISTLAVEELSDSGFATEEAATAKEAMAKLNTASFQAVIVDVGLPDRRGDALAEDIRKRWPDVMMIIATGYDAVELGRRFAADRRTRLITKPYTSELLLETLAELGISPLRIG